MADNAQKSWTREIIIAVVATGLGAVIVARLGLDKADKPAPPASQTPGDPPPTAAAPRPVRSGDLPFQPDSPLPAATTTVDDRLPAVMPTARSASRGDESPLLPPPRPATGTLVLDLPADDTPEWQVMLNGVRQSPSFRARRALGFQVPAGVHELRAHHRAGDFARQVVIRAGAQSQVAVTFPCGLALKSRTRHPAAAGQPGEYGAMASQQDNIRLD
jgi:hypothetical protein